MSSIKKIGLSDLPECHKRKWNEVPNKKYKNPTKIDISNLPKLPQGWIWLKIFEIGKVETGTTPSKAKIEYYGKDFPFYKPSDLNAGFYTKDSSDGLSKLGIEQARRLPAKSILVTSIGATIGKTGFIREEGASNQQINAIIPSDFVIPEYVYFLFISKFMQDLIIDNASATTLPILNKSRFELLPFPLSPINEQKRIVEKLEELLSDLEAGVEALKKVKAELKRYRQSVLKHAFEGKLTAKWREEHKDELEPASVLLERIREERKKALGGKYKEPMAVDTSNLPELPEGWESIQLDRLIYIAGRIGWRGLKADEYLDEGPLFLSVYNLNYGEKVDLRKTYHVSKARYDESPEIQLQNDDILLAKDGAGIGKIAILKDLKMEATVNSSLLVIRSGKALIPEFLFYYLKGPKMQEVVRDRITGSATPHLFQRDIKKFEILIPPLQEQFQIMHEIQRCFSITEEIERGIARGMLQSQRLRQSILKMAFEGKLVAQDPSDEPVEELLERIKFGQ